MRISRESPSLSIASVFGNPDRQHDLDAILAIAAAGRTLPGTGGQLGEPGTAVAAYGSLRPLPVWCVAPVLRSDRNPADLVRQAIREGLQLAEQNGCATVAIVLGERPSLVVPWREVTELVVETVQDYRCSGNQLRELRLLVSDSEALAHLDQCLGGEPAAAE